MIEVPREIPKKWRAVGVVVALVLVVGVVGVVQEAASVLHLHLPSFKKQPQQGQLTVVKDAGKAPFAFLEPVTSPDWKFDAKAVVFDETKGVVDYPVELTGGTLITISQQPMPDELKPYATSAKFTQFISNSNVNVSEPVGQGKLYFQEAMENNAPANGASTAIYATDKMLLFGQAKGILPYDKWSKLFAAMQTASPVK